MRLPINEKSSDKKKYNNNITVCTVHTAFFLPLQFYLGWLISIVIIKPNENSE